MKKTLAALLVLGVIFTSCSGGGGDSGGTAPGDSSPGGGGSDEYTYQHGTSNDSGQIEFDVETDSFVVQLKDEAGNPLQGVDVDLFEFESLDVLMVFSEDSTGDYISDLSFVDKTTMQELSGLQASGFQDEMIDLNVYLPRWYEAVSFKEGFITEGSHLDNICDELSNVLRPSYTCEDEVTLAELAEVYENKEFFNTTTGLLYELGTSIAPDGWLIDTVAKKDPGEWMATAAEIQEGLVELFGGNPQDICFEICRETKTGILVHRLVECEEELYNESPSATITSPSDGSTYTEGDTINFSGSGDDAEDGSLSGSSLVWISSIDGEIGTGTSFTRDDLSAGTHSITLTATDSEGATGSDSVSITLETEVILTVPGDYDNIYDALDAASSGVTVKVTGGSYTLSSQLLVEEGVTLTIESGTLIECHNNPISVYGTLNADGVTFENTNNIIFNSGSSGSVTNCVLTDTDDFDDSYAIILEASASPTISGNTITGFYTGNIALLVDSSMSEAWTVPIYERDYYLESITILSGKTLTIESGTLIECHNNPISVYGTLNADGVTFENTNNIIFNSGSSGSVTNCVLTDTDDFDDSYAIYVVSGCFPILSGNTITGFYEDVHYE